MASIKIYGEFYKFEDDAEKIATCAIEASAEFHTSTALPLTKYCIKLEG